MTIGAKINRLRRARGQTLRDVHRMMGISVSFLSEVERDESNLSVDMLQRIAQHFDMPVKSFFPSEWDWEPLNKGATP